MDPLFDQPAGPSSVGTVDEIPLEAPPEDVAEQREEVLPIGADGDGDGGQPRPSGRLSGSVPWDADPADYVEQHEEVPLDDDWA
jgi:hypothetical protein